MRKYRSEPPEGARATWWRQASPGVTYWRCQIPAKHLPGQVANFTVEDVKETDDGFVFPWQRGAAIWSFAGNGVRGIVMAEMQEQGTRVLMEVDDNYLRPGVRAPGTFKRDAGWSNYLDTEEDLHSHQAHKKILPWVDGVIVSTEALGDRYSAYNDNIFHCPNSADLDDWEKVEINPEGRRVGYAGSDSHYYDVALIRRAMDWAWRDGAELYKFGLARPWPYPHTQVPWTKDMAEYRRSLQKINIGLCPLRQDDWTDCKSDIKAIEYTLAGVLPIVQKSPPYSDWFDVVPTATDEKSWEKVVRAAIAMSDDELEAMWRQAYDFVLESKLIEQHIHKWREAVDA